MAITLGCDDPDVFEIRGQCYDQIGQYKLAAIDFTRALELAPDRHFDYYHRANVFRKGKQYLAAKQDYQKILSVSSNSKLVDLAQTRLQDITLQVALTAADELSLKGIQSTVLHMHTVKPIDSGKYLEYAARIPIIVTVEEHTIMGGLGSILAEVLVENSFESPKRFKRVGIPDAFADEYGSQRSLMEKYGITAQRVVREIEQLAKGT